jgi:signal transduction histidine kinase
MSKKDHIQREDIMGLGRHSLKKTYYTELLKKIRDLEEANNNLQSIFDHTNDAIIIHDCNGKLFKTNQIADKLFEITEQNSEPNFLDFIQSENQDIDFEKSWKKVLNNTSVTIEGPCKQVKSQKEIFIQISMSKTVLNGKDLIISLIRDFKQRMLYEKELLEARYKAEESDRLKTAFLANISHEIRTPMNGIIGFTQLLGDPEYTEDEKTSFIKIIDKSGQRMLNTINDIINIAKIESGQVNLFYQEVDINELMRYHFQFFLPESQTKNLDFRFRNYPIEEAVFIRTDEEKLTTIMSNLIKNAIKYTDKGFVEIDYQIDNNEFIFSVKDSGIGIPKDRLDAIFERFVQADIFDKESREGSGLGLAIIKAYTEMLNGHISIESIVGKGSTFCLTLPLKNQ